MEPSRVNRPVSGHDPRKPRTQDAPPKTQAPRRAGELAFARIGCSLCRAPFLLDVEEHWDRAPAEMESVGRKSLGVPAGAVLCPRCLHEVETAGAERIYWSLVGG